MPSGLSQPPLSSEPQDFTTARAFLWMLGAFFVMLLFAVVYISFNPDAVRDLVGLGIVSAASFTLMASYLLARYPGGTSATEGLGLRPSHPLAPLLGLLLGVTAKVPAEQLRAYVDNWFPLSAEKQDAMAELFRAETAVHRASLLIVIAIVVPLAEEIFFRGAVYGALRRSRVPEATALTVTAIGFTLVHSDPHQMLPLLMVAFLLGVLRSRSGSLLPSIFAHAGFNGAAIIGVTYGVIPDLEQLSVSQRLGVTVAFVFLLSLFLGLVGKHPRAKISRAEEQIAPQIVKEEDNA
jgi:membrane protease YdiL (CAAX protease family)